MFLRLCNAVPMLSLRESCHEKELQAVVEKLLRGNGKECQADQAKVNADRKPLSLRNVKNTGGIEMMTEVKERPILFSGPMVRAILDGRKTQTRRIVKDQPYQLLTKEQWHARAMSGVDPYGCRPIGSRVLEEMLQECPYGQPGERLWVREAWAPASAALPLADGVLYRADYHTSLEKRYGDQKWKPSIHMKRVDSRINLEITGIKVQRLNDISVEDAIAEGIEPVRSIWKLYGERVLGSTDATGQPRKSYASLWQSIHGPGSWAANPWVWVVEFRKV